MRRRLPGRAASTPADGRANLSLVPARRSLGLALHPASVGLARRVVRETLDVDGRAGAHADVAQLLVSELVTNAIVHARSEVGLTVSVTEELVRVEISDQNPHPPTQRAYDRGATTGRGLALLRALATRFGVVATAEGKVVWFTLGGPGPAAEPLPAPRGRVHQVRLLAVPVALYCVGHQHAAAMLRESLLVRLAERVGTRQVGDGTVTGDADPRADRIATANEALSVLATGTGDVFAARGTGQERLDTTVPVAARQMSAFAVLRDALAEAVTLAASGALLTPTSQPEMVALWNWCCSEVAAQAGGARPTPWRLAADPTAVKPPPDWDPADVSASAAAMIAADDTNRIIGVSPSAAELLGWTRAELVGRRLVTIVPERLREAHVAGYTHHLLTGERHIVGTPTDVPALHRDGSEIRVRLTIDVAPGTGPRSVFVATLESTGNRP